MLDQATVDLLALTSSPAAVIRAAYEDRAGVPAYDEAPPLQARDTLTACRYCGARFWDHSGGLRRYCDDACRDRYRYHSDPALRARRRAYFRAYHATRPPRGPRRRAAVA